MKSWQQLLAHYKRTSEDLFGPFTLEVGSAIVALQDATWFAHVGESLPLGVATVTSWDEALAIFEDYPRYSSKGHMSAAELAVIEALDANPDRIPWVGDAYDMARDTVDVSAFVPKSLPLEARIDIADHVHWYFRCVISEIIVQDATTCVFFREQLAWWHAGHVPCGWEGEWPEGKHRVY
jgi:hypothetical protein